MKVYLASQFHRQSEMQSYRNDLQEIGWEVTSSWLDEGAEEGSGAKYAFTDQMDLENADVLIFFMGPPYYGTSREMARGGRHVEFGYAWRSGKVLIVIGEYYENDYQKMPHVVHFDNWATFMEYVRL